jgi:hypothetical protein
MTRSNLTLAVLLAAFLVVGAADLGTLSMLHHVATVLQGLR